MNPTKTTKMGALLPEGTQDSFKAFQWKNADIFVWLHEDMPGIDHNVIAHWLNIDLKHCLVKQKHRAFNLEYQMQAVKFDHYNSLSNIKISTIFVF